MDRRHKHEEHENDERWLITYADLITLLMVFFVVMWSISRADAAKFASVSKSLSVAFGAPRGTIAPIPAAAPARSSKKAPKSADAQKNSGAGAETKLQSVASEIEKMIHERGLEEQISLDGSADGRKLTIRLRDSVLFDQGGSVLTGDAQGIIERLGAVLKDIGMRVSVSGHTDNVPVRSGAYQSNWQLSTARSTAVIESLITRVAFPPELLSASGYGEFHPIALNDTPENRAKNRRVEFVIVDEGPIAIAGVSNSPAVPTPPPSAPEAGTGSTAAGVEPVAPAVH